MSQVKDANEVEGIKAGKELKDLEYPLNNPDDYKGRLVFTVVEEPETDLGNVADAAAKFTESVGDDIKEAIGTENPEDVGERVWALSSTTSL